MLMLMRLTVLNIFMYSSPVSLLNHAHDVWYWVSSLTKYGLHLSCRLVYVSVSATVWYLFSFLQDIAIVQPLFCHLFFAFFRCCCKCVFHSTDKKFFRLPSLPFLFQFECEFYLYRFIYICMRCGSIFLLSLILLGFTHLSSTATWKMCHYQFHWLLITHTHYYHTSFPAIVFFEQRFCNE